MKIGIDFDRVLFKTDEFKDHLLQRFDDFEETYQDALEDGVYRPEEHAKLMDVKVDHILYELSKASEFLYNDVKILEETGEELELIIVSRGEPEFQGKKIRESGILDVIPEFKVVEQKPKDQVADIDFLIDDYKKELERVDVPGFLFDRSKHTIQDAIEKVEEVRESRSSV